MNGVNLIKTINSLKIVLKFNSFQTSFHIFIIYIIYIYISIHPKELEFMIAFIAFAHKQNARHMWDRHKEGCRRMVYLIWTWKVSILSL